MSNIKYNTNQAISVSILDDDIEPMVDMVKHGYDTSGIIAHILELITVDVDLDDDV